MFLGKERENKLLGLVPGKKGHIFSNWTICRAFHGKCSIIEAAMWCAAASCTDSLLETGTFVSRSLLGTNKHCGVLPPPLRTHTTTSLASGIVFLLLFMTGDNCSYVQAGEMANGVVPVTTAANHPRMQQGLKRGMVCPQPNTFAVEHSLDEGIVLTLVPG